MSGSDQFYSENLPYFMESLGKQQLYSGLAARLVLYLWNVSRREAIPLAGNVTGQAHFWASHYHQGGDQHFLNSLLSLESCRGKVLRFSTKTQVCVCSLLHQHNIAVCGSCQYNYTLPNCASSKRLLLSLYAFLSTRMFIVKTALRIALISF